jgi:hypothetical protein
VIGSSRHPRILADLLRRQQGDRLLQIALGGGAAAIDAVGSSAPPAAAAEYADAVIVLDGSGAPPIVGVALDFAIDFDAEIVSWTLLADVAGSIVLDLWKNVYANFPPTVADSICAAAKPTLAAAAKNSDDVLTGWTTAIAAGETIRVNIDSATVLARATLTLKLRRT